MFDMFDFNPFEVGNPMTLGMLEENGYEDFVNCEDAALYDDDIDEDDDSF